MLSVTFREFVRPLVWLDGRPLADAIEPYRWRIFDQAFARDDDGRFLYSLVVCGRSKKNWKTTDEMLAGLYRLLYDGPRDNEVYIVANDEGQAADDLALVKTLVKANPPLADALKVRANEVQRKDGRGAMTVLPAKDAIGAHGKTYALLAIDEIHGYRDWDLLEALAPDPTRLDAQQWITSYASLFHRPGAPLFDLMKLGRSGADPRMLFSWFAADLCTDPEYAGLPPEQRANPSMASWGNPEYLDQQRRRLPAHKFRRLHLNLPGLPEGSAFQPDPVMSAITRGISRRAPVAGTPYIAFVDMSGGSNDDATLAIGHHDVAADRLVVDLVMDQGQRPPFDPNKAVDRFVSVLGEYGVVSVVGDRYAGLTFQAQFSDAGIAYTPADLSASQHYEAFEVPLNAGTVDLPDVPQLEQQLLGLVWRGGRITHPAGEHDDYAAAVAGLVWRLDRGAGETADHDMVDTEAGGGIGSEFSKSARMRRAMVSGAASWEYDNEAGANEDDDDG